MHDDLRAVAAMAEAAGAMARAHLGRSERLTKTHGHTFDEAVTAVDRAVQRALIADLHARFPDDGIIGEESEDGAGITHLPPRRGGRTWVIDPLDGTNNFIAGLDAVAVCVGALRDGMPESGVVHAVADGRTWCGQVGAGAWRCDRGCWRPIRCAQGPLQPAALVMLTSNLLDADGRLPAAIGRWFGTAPWKARMLGSAALEAVLAGDGTAAAAYSPNAKLWDVAAAATVVIAAGGEVRRPDGAPLFPFATAGYRGAKTPFLAGGAIAVAQLIADLRAS